MKYAAFLPADDMKASVCRIDGCTEAQVWEIDRNHVSGARRDGKISKARADTKVQDIRRSQLDVVSDPSSYPRHANIERYPSEKSEIKLRAMELAKSATLVLKS